MPISLSCPECDSPQTVPDESAGTTFDCQKCGVPFLVPEEEALPVVELVDDEPARPAVRPQVVEDDAESNDQPVEVKVKKKKKKKKAKQGMNPAVKWGLLACGVVGLLTVLVIGGYNLFRSPPVPPDKEIAGEGWYKVQEKDDWFTAYFPGGQPEYEKHGFQIPQFLADKANAKSEDLGWNIQMWNRKDGGREYGIFLFALPAKGSESDPKLAEQAAARTRLAPGPNVVVKVDDKVTVGKRTGRRFAVQGGSETKVSMLFGLESHHILGVMVTGPDAFDHTDPKVVAFFENFTLNR